MSLALLERPQACCRWQLMLLLVRAAVLRGPASGKVMNPDPRLTCRPRYSRWGVAVQNGVGMYRNGEVWLHIPTGPLPPGQHDVLVGEWPGPMQLWQLEVMGGMFLASGAEMKLASGPGGTAPTEPISRRSDRDDRAPGSATGPRTSRSSRPVLG
jgi:hypothetical protein